ncbi:hypothetical protein MKW98_006054, partial [Papaver atlanticum]
MNAQGDVETHDVPPLDAVKFLADKCNALMENLGLETLDGNENDGDYPQQPYEFREKIEHLEETVDMTVAFGEY